MTHLYLDHFYRGKLIKSGIPQGEFSVTAYSPPLKWSEAQEIYSHLGLGAIDITHIASGGLALVPIRLAQGKIEKGISRSEYSLFAYFRPSQVKDRRYHYDEYHCWIFETPSLLELDGDFLGFWDHISQEQVFPTFETIMEMPRFEFIIKNQKGITSNRNSRINKQREILQREYKISNDTIETIFTCLENNTPILITNGPSEIHHRISFIQALLMMLPQNLAIRKSFSTHIFNQSRNNLNIAFSQNNVNPRGSAILDFSSMQFQGDTPNNDFGLSTLLLYVWQHTNTQKWLEVDRRIANNVSDFSSTEQVKNASLDIYVDFLLSDFRDIQNEHHIEIYLRFLARKFSKNQQKVIEVIYQLVDAVISIDDFISYKADVIRHLLNIKISEHEQNRFHQLIIESAQQGRGLIAYEFVIDLFRHSELPEWSKMLDTISAIHTEYLVHEINSSQGRTSDAEIEMIHFVHTLFQAVVISRPPVNTSIFFERVQDRINILVKNPMLQTWILLLAQIDLPYSRTYLSLWYNNPRLMRTWYKYFDFVHVQMRELLDSTLSEDELHDIQQQIETPSLLRRIWGRYFPKTEQVTDRNWSIPWYRQLYYRLPTDIIKISSVIIFFILLLSLVISSITIRNTSRQLLAYQKLTEIENIEASDTLGRLNLAVEAMELHTGVGETALEEQLYAHFETIAEKYVQPFVLDLTLINPEDLPIFVVAQGGIVNFRDVFTGSEVVYEFASTSASPILNLTGIQQLDSENLIVWNENQIQLWEITLQSQTLYIEVAPTGVDIQILAGNTENTTGTANNETPSSEETSIPQAHSYSPITLREDPQNSVSLYVNTRRSQLVIYLSATRMTYTATIDSNTGIINAILSETSYNNNDLIGFSAGEPVRRSSLPDIFPLEFFIIPNLNYDGELLMVLKNTGASSTLEIYNAPFQQSEMSYHVPLDKSIIRAEWLNDVLIALYSENGFIGFDIYPVDSNKVIQFARLCCDDLQGESSVSTP